LERDEIVVRESLRRAIVGMDGPWGWEEERKYEA
jgi:hypothetical protein